MNYPTLFSLNGLVLLVVGTGFLMFVTYLMVAIIHSLMWLVAG